MPGADESGELADAGIAADILRESGGTPEAAERERGGNARPSRRPATSRRAAPSDENARDDDDDPNQDDTPELDPEADPQADPEADPQGRAADPEADPNADPEADSEADPEQDPEADPAAAPAEEEPARDETPEWAKKRFAELTGQIRNLRTENEQLRQEREGAAPARPAVADADVLNAESPEQLARLREEAERLEEWADLNREGVEADPENPNARPYTAQEVAQVRVNARRRLRAIEQRRDAVALTQRYNAAATQLYPGFSDPDSEESRAVSQLLRQVPELRRLPNYRVIVGDAIAGERARLKAKQPAARQMPDGRSLPGKPVVQAANRRPPAAPAAPVRSQAAPAGKQAVRQQARERAFKTGSEADLARLVEASLGS